MGAFDGTIWLREKRNEKRLVIHHGTLIDGVACSNGIYIPNSVTIIGDSAFAGNSYISFFKFPHYLTKIGEESFKNCNRLLSITIPDSVVSLSGDAFYGCSSLKEVKISKGITHIEDYTFGNCTNLKEIMIPKSVVYISPDAFYSCGAFTIICEKGSYAEKFAIDKGYKIKFIRK